jgi:hypothetical protein
MAQSRETGDPLVTDNNLIISLLEAPLSPDWTVEGLAEQVLSAIAVHRSEEGEEFVLDAAAITDRQVRRILRPLLACLATKSAAEAGTPANLYGGHLTFQRPGREGSVRICGQFENRPGCAHVTLRRHHSPSPGERHGTVPRKSPVDVPGTAPSEERSTLDKRVNSKIPNRSHEHSRTEPSVDVDRT